MPTGGGSTLGLQPYGSLSTVVTNGLTSIVNQLKAITTPATSDVVNAVGSYFETVFYPSSGKLPANVQVQLQATGYAVINNYNNSISPRVAPLLNCMQSYLATLSLGLPVITDLSTSDIPTWLTDIRDNITKTNLTIDDQSSLMLGVIYLNAFYSYFNSQINNSTNAFWAKYFSSNAAENYANLKIWCAAGVTGGLIGYSASTKGLVSPTNDIVSVTVISSLMGAFTIAFGKIMFGWEPRIQPVSIFGYGQG